MDSGLEAFSHYPTDGSGKSLFCRTNLQTRDQARQFLSVNNPTLCEFCFAMIRRADIEGSKSNVAMSAWLPQASYPCGHSFEFPTSTGSQNKTGFCPFALREISVPTEPVFGHLRYFLTNVPPQPNSPPETVLGRQLNAKRGGISPSGCPSHLFYTFRVTMQYQTRVKLNRVFFPRCKYQARSPGCGFAFPFFGAGILTRFPFGLKMNMLPAKSTCASITASSPY
eukprot:gene4049-4695_t